MIVDANHCEWEVLWKMGFPFIFINCLKVLYCGLTTAVWLGGGLSSSFSLLRGTRQGCPLSLVFFSIAIEPVAEVLCTSLLIKGLWVSWLEERVVLYANDLLLFPNDAGPSPGSLQVLVSFSTITCLKGSWA